MVIASHVPEMRENREINMFLHRRRKMSILTLGASFVYYLNCRWSSSDKPYMTENVILRPSYEPRGQKQIPNLSANLQDMPNHFLANKLSNPENRDVV